MNQGSNPRKLWFRCGIILDFKLIFFVKSPIRYFKWTFLLNRPTVRLKNFKGGSGITNFEFYQSAMKFIFQSLLKSLETRIFSQFSIFTAYLGFSITIYVTKKTKYSALSPFIKEFERFRAFQNRINCEKCKAYSIHFKNQIQRKLLTKTSNLK